MIDRRDILVGSAVALAVSVVTPSTPAFSQAAGVPSTKRGFLERPGCRIYYEVTGSGPPVIFVHGLGSNHLTWWQQVAHLSNNYTCVTFAHRGYPPGSEIGVPDPKRICWRSRGTNRPSTAIRCADRGAIDGRTNHYGIRPHSSRA